MEEWKNGRMEEWDHTIPSFHYSIIPKTTYFKN